MNSKSMQGIKELDGSSIFAHYLRLHLDNVDVMVQEKIN